MLATSYNIANNTRNMSSRFTNFCLSIAAAVFCSTTLYAANESYQTLRAEAQQLHNSSNLHDLEQAFMKYWDAFMKAPKSEQNDINDELIECLNKYNEHAIVSRANYLDTPERVYSELFIDRLVSLDDRRGLRLKGELLMERNDAAAITYLTKAANNGDGRAAFLMYEIKLLGKLSAPIDKKECMIWLNMAADKGYAPAYLELANRYWSGRLTDYNRNLAIEYLQKAIDGFNFWSLGNENDNKKLQDYIGILQSTKARLEAINNSSRYWDAEAMESIDKDCNFDFLAVFLASINESDYGLQLKLLYIANEFNRYSGDYCATGLALINPNYIPIRGVYKNDVTWSGLHTSDGDFCTVSSNIQINLSKFPQISSELKGKAYTQAFYNRQMQLHDTIAHELAHCYFRLRYPATALYSEADHKHTYEGHATNAAYGFMKVHYFSYTYDSYLDAGTYANMFLSDEYKKYFYWFRREGYLSPVGLLLTTEKLDQFEQTISGKIPYNREQNTSTQQLNLKYFGRGFYGPI